MAGEESEAGTGLGASLEYERAPGDWFELGEVTRIGLPPRTAEKVDVTHLKSPNGYKEYRPAGTIDPGEVPISYNFVPGSDTDAEIVAWMDDRTVLPIRIVFPEAYGVVWEFKGFPIDHTPGELALDEKMDGAATFALTGSRLEGVPTT